MKLCIWFGWYFYYIIYCKTRFSHSTGRYVKIGELSPTSHQPPRFIVLGPFVEVVLLLPPGRHSICRRTTSPPSKRYSNRYYVSPPKLFIKIAFLWQISLYRRVLDFTGTAAAMSEIFCRRLDGIFEYLLELLIK